MQFAARWRLSELKDAFLSRDEGAVASTHRGFGIRIIAMGRTLSSIGNGYSDDQQCQPLNKSHSKSLLNYGILSSADFLEHCNYPELVVLLGNDAAAAISTHSRKGD